MRIRFPQLLATAILAALGVLDVGAQTIYYPPTSLAGATLLATATNGPTVLITLGFCSTAFSQNGGVDDGTGNYTYTKTGTNTATIHMVKTAPPGVAGNISDALLVFYSPTNGAFVSSFSDPGGYISSSSGVFELVIPAAPGQAYTDFTFITNNGAITLTRYNGTNSVVTIPSCVADLPVATIGEYAFESCWDLTNVVIPSSVTSIGVGAFSLCGLTSVTIPNGVSVIDESAFEQCFDLMNVVIPESVTRIGDFAFCNCALTSITIPGSVTSIGSYAFADSELTTVYFKGNAPSAGSLVFDGTGVELVYYMAGTTGWSSTFDGYPTACWNRAPDSLAGDTILATITNGPSTTNGSTIAVSLVFDTATFLQTGNGDDETGTYTYVRTHTDTATIHLAKTAPPAVAGNSADFSLLFSSPTNGTFVGSDSKSGGLSATNAGTFHLIVDLSYTNFAFITNDGAITITGYVGTDSAVTIPSRIAGLPVVSIADYAFYGCLLTSVAFPDSLTSIADYAFSECPLTSVTLPNSLTNIGVGAFSDCSLTTVTIPHSVNYIGDIAFAGCPSLTSAFFLGNAPFYFGEGVFPYPENPEGGEAPSFTIYYPSTAAGWTAPFWMFHTARPYSQVSYNGFHYTVNGGNVTIVYYSGPGGLVSIPSSIPGAGTVTSVGLYAFYRCTSPSCIIIPDSVTNIGERAFSDCTSLTNITIPNTVSSIGNSAFSGCTSLTGVTIPNNVTSIGDRAFLNCKSLTSVTIPSNVTSIGEEAFSGCRSLTEITIPDSVNHIGNRAFAYCYSLTSAFFLGNAPSSFGEEAFYGGAVMRYPFTATGWTTPFWMGYIALPYSEVPYNGFHYSVNESNVTIVYYSGPGGLISIPSSIPGVGTVTSIGLYAFYRCTSPSCIIIPDSVTNIGERAFSDCTSLTNITIPNTVSTIGNSAFVYCTRLTSVSIPNNVTSIPEAAFDGCESLTSVTIPNSVTSIGFSAFQGCTSLINIAIPKSVSSIGDFAFCGCTSLTNITIPNTVCSIGYYVFWDCTSLTSVTIPNSVTSIGERAFSGCTDLTNITIPHNVNYIGNRAFAYCCSLASVFFLGDVPSSFGEAVFAEVEDLVIYYPSTATGWTTPTWLGYASKPFDYTPPEHLPVLSLLRAPGTVTPSFSNLQLGTNYQLQISTDLGAWNNTGDSFRATGTSVVCPQPFDVMTRKQLFFRLRSVP